MSSPVTGLVCPLDRFPLAVMSRKVFFLMCAPCILAHYIRWLTPSYLCHFEKLWDSRHSSEEFLIDVQAFFTLGFLHVKVLLCRWEKEWSQIFRFPFPTTFSGGLLASPRDFTRPSYAWHLSSQHDPKQLSLVCQSLTETLFQHVTTERSQRMPKPLYRAIQHKHSVGLLF